MTGLRYRHSHDAAARDGSHHHSRRSPRNLRTRWTRKETELALDETKHLPGGSASRIGRFFAVGNEQTIAIGRRQQFGRSGYCRREFSCGDLIREGSFVEHGVGMVAYLQRGEGKFASTITASAKLLPATN